MMLSRHDFYSMPRDRVAHRGLSSGWNILRYPCTPLLARVQAMRLPGACFRPLLTVPFHRGTRPRSAPCFTVFSPFPVSTGALFIFHPSRKPRTGIKHRETVVFEAEDCVLRAVCLWGTSLSSTACLSLAGAMVAWQMIPASTK